MAISSNINNAVRVAIDADNKAAGKWNAAGAAIKAEYESRAAFEAIKAEFIDTVILPAMGDNAVKAIKIDLPRKNSTEYKERVAKEPSYAAAWETANQLKRDTKAMSHTYHKRIGDYAFGKEETGPTEPRTLKTRTVEELTALLKAHEKSEQGSVEVIKYLDLAMKAAMKM